MSETAGRTDMASPHFDASSAGMLSRRVRALGSLSGQRGLDASLTRPVWIGLSALGLVLLGSLAFANHGYDLTSYWHIPADPYPAIDGLSGQAVFRYAPPVMLLFRPLELLPWGAVAVLWFGLQLAALWYIGRRWFLALVCFPPVLLDLAYGNVNIFIAAAILSRAGWAFVLLTKVTPGVGLLWFIVRREWRALGLALGITAAAVAFSLIVQGPALWASWFDSLARSSQMPVTEYALAVPLLPRMALAAVLVTWGGLTDRRWTVPVAVTLAMPVVWLIALTPLISLGARPGHRSDANLGL